MYSEIVLIYVIKSNKDANLVRFINKQFKKNAEQTQKNV